MYKIGMGRVGSAQKIQDGDMFGYLVEKESGALACFFQAQHRPFWSLDSERITESQNCAREVGFLEASQREGGWDV
jgi:hypothetical protein